MSSITLEKGIINNLLLDLYGSNDKQGIISHEKKLRLSTKIKLVKLAKRLEIEERDFFNLIKSITEVVADEDRTNAVENIAKESIKIDTDLTVDELDDRLESTNYGCFIYVLETLTQ